MSVEIRVAHVSLRVLYLPRQWESEMSAHVRCMDNAGSDGESKIHSGKSAHFLLGHTTHNIFLGYNFCMYPVILYSVG